MDGAVFNNPMDIEEKVDPSTGKPYFYHRRSRKSAWSREELLIATEEEVVRTWSCSKITPACG
jgi:hypothetical protein